MVDGDSDNGKEVIIRLNQYIINIPLSTLRDKLNIPDNITGITPASFQANKSTISFIIQSDTPLKTMKDRTLPEVSFHEISKKKPGRPKKKASKL